MRLGQVKDYTLDELKQRISKKYHDMIDWNATMFCGFDGTFVLKDNGQLRCLLSADDYGTVRNANWYLKRIMEDPSFDY
jgi:predicted KAP-like P-loop ATPase